MGNKGVEQVHSFPECEVPDVGKEGNREGKILQGMEPRFTWRKGRKYVGNYNSGAESEASQGNPAPPGRKLPTYQSRRGF